MNKLGKYELIQELGRGAMGVYRARDPIINRLVALKTITRGVAEDPSMLQRFLPRGTVRARVATSQYRYDL